MSNPAKWQITDERSERGFRQYASDTDRYGATVRIAESSSVEPCLWVFVEGGSIDSNKGSMLLSPDDAKDFALALLRAAQEKAS